jgi:hypothetical protein
VLILDAAAENPTHTAKYEHGKIVYNLNSKFQISY